MRTCAWMVLLTATALLGTVGCGSGERGGVTFAPPASEKLGTGRPPSVPVTVPVSVHPGDDWMRASVPAVTSALYTWSVEPGTSTATLTQGQGTPSIGFSAGNALGSFQIQAVVALLGGPLVRGAATVQVQTGTWVAKAPFQSLPWRYLHTAIRLKDGTVLVTGGISYNAAGSYLNKTLDTSERYDPLTRLWTPTGNLGTARRSHTATVLEDGTVLVAGGYDGSGNPLASTESYDPGTGVWTPGLSMTIPRANFAATSLPGKKVLFTGGHTGLPFDVTNRSEIFNYSSEPKTMTRIADMGAHRTRHTATALPDGSVVVVGGNQNLGFIEIFNPSTEQWRPTSAAGPPVLSGHTATLLGNGKVLVTGGTASFGELTDWAMLFDAATDVLNLTGPLLAKRNLHTAILLPNGKVLVTDGFTNNSNSPYNPLPINSSEIYDPVLGTFTPTGALGQKRVSFTSTLLEDGTVLAAFGTHGYDTDAQPRTEIYLPKRPTDQP